MKMLENFWHWMKYFYATLLLKAGTHLIEYANEVKPQSVPVPSEPVKIVEVPKPAGDLEFDEAIKALERLSQKMENPNDTQSLRDLLIAHEQSEVHPYRAVNDYFASHSKSVESGAFQNAEKLAAGSRVGVLKRQANVPDEPMATRVTLSTKKRMMELHTAKVANENVIFETFDVNELAMIDEVREEADALKANAAPVIRVALKQKKLRKKMKAKAAKKVIRGK
jgi:hypothetical protein